MTSTYKHAHELSPGTVIYLGPSSTTHSVVVEVREHAHGVAAAYGAQTIVVDLWLQSRGHYTRKTVTAWPDDTFRRVPDDIANILASVYTQPIGALR